MRETRKLAQNAAIQIIGKTIATIMGVLTVAILGRYLGVEGYGQFTIALSFLSIFAVIVDFGLTLTTTQMISEHEADEPKLLGNLLTLRIISAILFLSLAPIVAVFFPYDEIIRLSIAVGAFSYLFGTTAQMFVGVFQKRMLMSRVVLAELANRGLVLLGVIFAPFFHLNIVDVVWLLVVGNGIQLLIMLAQTRALVAFKPKLNLAIWKTIIVRSWPIGASIFFNLIYMRGDVIFLSVFRSNTETGLYGAAYKVVDVVTAIPVMYMGIALPLLVGAWSASRTNRFKDYMQKSFDFLSIIATPIIFGSIAIGVPLMELIMGRDFSQSGQVLMILGPAAAIVFWNSLFGHAVVALNKQKIMTWGYLAVAIFTIAGYILFIPSYGMWAAAWLTLFSETLIGLLTFLVVWRVSHYSPSLKMLSKAILASIIMFMAIMIMPDVSTAIMLPLSMLVYAVALTALGGPKPMEILNLFLPEKPPISQP
ncbi:flippase [Patescibacteria group bacterium]|nr:flippase [Patescibacteria group bacterium]MBU4452894.1 flippase [Patescibacteria group bacterium]MCG2687511.1 flippase [Candidatus Parcubacteria bacterium]